MSGGTTIQQGEEGAYAREWLIFIVITNLLLIGQLYVYKGGGGFIGRFPAVYVTLSLVGVVTLIGNSWFAWQYLGQPDLSQLYQFEPRKEAESGSTTNAGGNGGEE